MSVLSRWKANLAGAKAAEKRAKDEHTKAQEALEAARAADLHPRTALVMARDRASQALKRSREDVGYAQRVVARHSGVNPPSPDKTQISPNQSSRGGVKPRLIVLHITVSNNVAGYGDIDGILNFFGQRSAQASSHIVNDREGHDARCVPDEAKAWTCAAYNSMSLNIEQIEREVKSRERWLEESMPQLENTARWVAYWSVKYGIPLKESTSSGVCQHRDLGAAGGGHADCSPTFPLDVVLQKARGYAASYKRA